MLKINDRVEDEYGRPYIITEAPESWKQSGDINTLNMIKYDSGLYAKGIRYDTKDINGIPMKARSRSRRIGWDLTKNERNDQQ